MINKLINHSINIFLKQYVCGKYRIRMYRMVANQNIFVFDIYDKEIQETIISIIYDRISKELYHSQKMIGHDKDMNIILGSGMKEYREFYVLNDDDE